MRIVGAPAALGAREIVAALHHDTGQTRVEPCAPIPHALLERLSQTRALCEHCRTVRPRKQTWLLRNRATGQTMQVGSSCIKPLTGAASVEQALARAQALAGAHAALATLAATAHAGEPRTPAPGDKYIDTTRFVAHAAAVVREQGFWPAPRAR
jgi:hypothetical protein